MTTAAAAAQTIVGGHRLFYITNRDSHHTPMPIYVHCLKLSATVPMTLSAANGVQFTGKSSESVQCAMLRPVTHAQTWASYYALYRFGRLRPARTVQT